MRKLGAWALAATLIVGLGTAVGRAAEDDPEGASAKPGPKATTWHWSSFARWFGSKEEKQTADKKPSPKPGKVVAKKPAAPAKPPSVVDEAAAERAREEAALLRRLQACDKLKEIAIRVNDNDLLRRAEELEERAQTAYAQRTAYLRGRGGFESDEKTLEQYLGAGKVHSADAPAYTATGNERSSRAAVKEVNP